MYNLIQFCKQLFGKKPKKANTVFLRFPIKEGVDELFDIIKQIFLYGFSDEICRNGDSFKLTKLSLERFSQVSEYMKSFGIIPHLNMFTFDDVVNIYNNLCDNITPIEGLSVEIELDKKDFDAKISFKARNIKPSKMNRLVDSVLNSTENIFLIKNFKRKKTKLNEFFFRIVLNKIMYVVHFDFYTENISALQQIQKMGQYKQF